MGSAKQTFKEQDRSAIVPVLSGISIGLAVNSERGDVLEPRLVTTEQQLYQWYGKPNPKLGPTMYAAVKQLKASRKLYIVRAANQGSRYAAALVRSKILEIPTSQLGSITDEHRIVNPINGGLTQEQVDKYQFPTYSANKEFELAKEVIHKNVVDSNRIRIKELFKLKVGDEIGFSDLGVALLNSDKDSVGENLPTYRITDIKVVDEEYEKLVLDTQVTVNINDKVTTTDGSEFTGKPIISRSENLSSEVLVSNSDYIPEGIDIKVGSTTVRVTHKEKYVEKVTYLVIDGKVTAPVSHNIYKVVKSAQEDRDVLLVTARNQGEWGNKISIATSASKNYPDAFVLSVFYDGVLVEEHEVTLDSFIDGYNKQLEVEYRINNDSSYIRVKQNHNNVDDNGKYNMPLFTGYSLWQQLPDDIFLRTNNNLNEDLLQGHYEVKLTSVEGLSLGDRIKFSVDDGVLSKEYKIVTINGSTVLLDRAIEESKGIPKTFKNSSNQVRTSAVYRFDPTFNDTSKGISAGIQYYKIQRLNKTYHYPINFGFSISGIEGKLLDAGTNFMLGGYADPITTTGTMIQAADKLSNYEITPVNIIMDGGYTVPAYAQKLAEIAKTSGQLTHAFLSVKFDAEESSDYMRKILEYRRSLNLDTDKASLFCGWNKYYDPFNETEVWTSPDADAAYAQSLVTTNYTIFTPAAGLVKGKIEGLGVRRQFTEGERDELVDNQINPIRVRNGNTYLWGNETLYTKPSPLQLRSVAFLLIFIKQSLRETLDFKLFERNDEDTWTEVELIINAFMRDEVKAKHGVYDYKVSVKDIITKSDIDNRRMPIYIGLQPTMDIKMIDTYLSIYNASLNIEVTV